jgi:hypothetical protein
MSPWLWQLLLNEHSELQRRPPHYRTPVIWILDYWVSNTNCKAGKMATDPTAGRNLSTQANALEMPSFLGRWAARLDE